MNRNRDFEVIIVGSGPAGAVAAAGLADPLTGEGISYAIRGGRLAAEAVLAALNGPDASLEA